MWQCVVVCTPLATFTEKYPVLVVACFGLGASKVEEASAAKVWGIIVY